MLLILDALDESSDQGKELLGLMEPERGELVKALPLGVSVLFSSTLALPEKRKSWFQLEMLDADATENRKDIEAAATFWLRNESALLWPENDIARVAGSVCKKAVGVIQYAWFAYQMVVEFTGSPDNAVALTDSFPSGLQGLYRAYLTRVFQRLGDDHKGRKLCTMALKVVAAVKAPRLPLQMLLFVLQEGDEGKQSPLREAAERALNALKTLFEPSLKTRTVALHRSVLLWLRPGVRRYTGVTARGSNTAAGGISEASGCQRERECGDWSNEDSDEDEILQEPDEKEPTELRELLADRKGAAVDGHKHVYVALQKNSKRAGKVFELYADGNQLERCRQVLALSALHGGDVQDQTLALLRSCQKACKTRRAGHGRFLDADDEPVTNIMDRTVESFHHDLTIEGWNMIVDAHRRKDINQAEQVLQRMHEAGVQANTVTYNALVDGYMKERKLDQAEQIGKAKGRERVNEKE